MIHVIGNLGGLGGARTELWHSLRLWRRGGIDVMLWTVEPPTKAWREAACNLGMEVREVGHRHEPPAGSLVVGWCESMFWILHEAMKARDCRTVWVGCMTEPSITERVERQTADMHVYQSLAQRERMMLWHTKQGATEPPSRLIRGAFDLELFPWRPQSRDPDGTFTVGMLARDDPRKWPADLWEVYGRLAVAGLRARVMGVEESVRRRIGPPPSWADVLSPEAEPTAPFIRSLDCMFVPPVEVVENWPRVGLEAMACGVPVVVHRRGGWREMIDNTETGFCRPTVAEMLDDVRRMAADEPYRRRIAESAREELESQHANPDAWLDEWRDLIGELDG